jgi:hypothetical protein
MEVVIKEKLNQIMKTIESNTSTEELNRLWGKFITHLNYFIGYFDPRIYLCMKISEKENKLEIKFDKDSSIPVINE